jgi:hypothetical protein
MNVAAYTIRLCKNGKEFQSLPNVADVGPRPTSVGCVIEGKWKVRGVVRHSASELVVDVEPLAGQKSMPTGRAPE